MNADVLNALCQAATEIHSLLQAGKGLTVAGDLNATGDKQLELDLVADRILVERLSQLDCVRFVASEERPELLRAGRNPRALDHRSSRENGCIAGRKRAALQTQTPGPHGVQLQHKRREYGERRFHSWRDPRA